MQISISNSVGSRSKSNTPPISTDFISLWDTSLGDGNPTIALPLYDGGNYYFTVNWGDGNSDVITAWDQLEVTHTYVTGGQYTIIITGTIEGWSFNEIGDCGKLKKIQNIGILKLGNIGGYFAGCNNLTSIKGTFDLTGVTNMSGMFSNCSSLTSVYRIKLWDVSAVTNMIAMFNGAVSFNTSLNLWDTSSVTSMDAMFSYASSFNQDISSWNTSAVNSICNGNNAFFNGYS